MIDENISKELEEINRIIAVMKGNLSNGQSCEDSKYEASSKIHKAWCPAGENLHE
jgi:hypothetical protein